MNEFEKSNSALISEANTILYDYGLLEILKKYGKPIIQGSYSLDLMTWRDLDILLEMERMDIRNFFSLGLDIVTKLRPRKMSYRNELIGKTSGLPKGLYWGIYTLLTFPAEWKIDIWAMDADQTKSRCKEFENLKSKISEENRPIILMIKNHYCNNPKYRGDFFSIDIYKSVIEENVKSVEEFSKWLKEKRGIE
jgi:hypothetical protein